jgi:hypothetical protein
MTAGLTLWIGIAVFLILPIIAYSSLPLTSWMGLPLAKSIASWVKVPDVMTIPPDAFLS